MVQYIFNPFTSNFDAIGLGAGDVVPASQGGTGITSYTIGDILYASGTTTLAKLGIGTIGQVLTVSALGLPSWATPTPVSISLSADNNTQGPATGSSFLISGGTTGLSTKAETSGEKITIQGTLNATSGGTGQSVFAIGDLLYASSTTALSRLATALDGILITSHTGVLSWLANGTTGQLLTATTNSPASWQAAPLPVLAPNSISASQTMLVNNIYSVTSGTPSLALPVTAAAGSVIEVALSGGTSWTITQQTGQSIIFGTVTTTTTTGTLASNRAGDWVHLECVTANTLWQACVFQGDAITYT